MGVGPYDGDDVRVKGDDGSDDGVKITSSTISSKKCLDVAIANTVPIATTEEEAPTFVAYALGIAIGNNKSMMSIVNAAASGYYLHIREIRIINVQNSAVTGIISDWRLLRCTGHSAGTDVTPAEHDTAETLQAGTTVKTGATISGEGTAVYRRWQFSTDEWGVGAADVESGSHDTQMNRSLFDTAPKTKTIILREGEGITIKQTVNSTVGTFDIMVVFTQDPN